MPIIWKKLATIKLIVLYKNVELGTETLWENVRGEIVTSEDGYLIFDDTVIKKKYSQKIELVRRQYSGNEHGVVSGIGIVNCLYFNPDLERFWIIDYRIYNPENDEKSKIDHVQEMMVDVVKKKKIPVKTVLMESWSATQRLMALIDNLGKIYYCPWKFNRLVDDSGGVKKYQKLEELKWNELELVSGKIIKIKGIPVREKSQIPYGVLFLQTSAEYMAISWPQLPKYRWRWVGNSN